MRNASQVRTEGNHLGGESSLYLRQHARNPVDWYPWCEAALRQAREEDKPVFLSVGYSACHWCHVMEREVFESDRAAELLNEHYISIKVDREERPDLDAAYMAVLQLLTGGGGWPMSLFLTPGGKPIFAATYLPLEQFLHVAGRVHLVYREERATIEHQAALIQQSLSGMTRDAQKVSIDAVAIEAIIVRELAVLDRRWGGLRGSPKFPTPPRWAFLLRHFQRTGDDRCARAVEQTLDNIASGGLHDHLEGGFHRYSVDEQWIVPHFEKMLYDNAQLASLFLEAAVVMDRPRYLEVARSTLAFLESQMTDEAGGFFSSIDADSGGEEGAYYLWSEGELLGLAGPVDGPLLARSLGVTRGGDHQGRSALTKRAVEEPAVVASGWRQRELEVLWERWLPLLRERRACRERPTVDRKILTSWNGLAISAFSQGFRLLGDTRLRSAAERAAGYLRRVHRQADGGLHRSSYGGVPRHQGVLGDYANLIRGLVDLSQASLELHHFEWALELVDRVMACFSSPDGGFFLTPEGAEAPLGRRTELMDSVRPSGNAAMLGVLLDVAALTSNESLRARVERAVAARGSMIGRAGLEMAAWLDVAERLESPQATVVVAGDADDGETRAMVTVVQRMLRPDVLLVAVPPAGPSAEQKRLLPITEGKRAVGSRPAAYVCHRGSCLPPLLEAEGLRRSLLPSA